MLSKDEIDIIVNMMLLQDSMKKHIQPKIEIKEMTKAGEELIGFIDGMWDDLNEEEKNQVLDSYKEQKNKQTKTLPPKE